MNHQHNYWKSSIALALLSTIGGSVAFAEELPPDQLQFFEQQVRPLLVKRCHECHSAEAETAEGGLRLDSRDGWETGGDSGAAIEAGNVEGSLLITAIRYDGLEMPPDGKLSPVEIAVFEKWVEMGAPDPRTEPASVTHGVEINFDEARRAWAFQRPQRHEPPDILNTEWPRDDIDRFILTKIEAAGLTPTSDAEPWTWLRRVTFDLTGLPPTPEAIENFTAEVGDGRIDNPSYEAAKARVVDRLLGSSAFGEHWGRHWLDVARYADTNGGDFNATYKSAWRYRDYVIAALNNDKPFDEFVREQLAGDLLPYASDEERAEQLIATGFLMIGCKMLSERDKTKFRMDVVDEQIDTVGRAFLGLTLGCARCHDHKFDPLPTEDYYALAGILQSTESYRGESQKYVSTWKEVELPVESVVKAAINAHSDRKDELQASIKELEGKQKAASDNLKTLDPGLEGIIVDDTQAELVGEWKKSTHNSRYFGEGYIHNNKEALGEKSVTFRPGITSTGEYEVRMAYAGSGGRATNVPVLVTHADGEERLTVDETKLPPINDLWLPLGTFRFETDGKSAVTVQTKKTDGYVLADAMQFIPLDHAKAGDAAAEPGPEVSALREQVSDLTKQIEATRKQLKEHEADAPPPIPTCMAVREHAQIGDAAVRIRGEVHREGDIIPRGFLTILAESERPQLTDTSQSGRLELANWIASPDNPLTARVIVNRVWHHLFGRGIVATVDNFGQLGQPPTHAELLDTLAVEFMNDGWSLKRLIRCIVLCRTYGLSSTPSSPRATPRGYAGSVGTDLHGESPAGLNDVDPRNDLLTHFRRRRLTGEQLRDAMLAVSGRLDRTAGGSSVEPLEYLAIATSGKKSADLKVDDNQRRSVYLPMVRNDLPEFLRLFDIADPELVTGRRPVTNVPAQALYLMNSPFVATTAEQAVVALLEKNVTDEKRLEQAYVLLLSRNPTDVERERALNFLTSGGPESTEASWTQLLHILLASTEFRMLD